MKKRTVVMVMVAILSFLAATDVMAEEKGPASKNVELKTGPYKSGETNWRYDARSRADREIRNALVTEYVRVFDKKGQEIDPLKPSFGQKGMFSNWYMMAKYASFKYYPKKKEVQGIFKASELAVFNYLKNMAVGLTGFGVSVKVGGYLYERDPEIK